MEHPIELVEDLPQIDRSSLLDTIDNIFSANTDLLIIRGQEEIGKTTLLKQFVARHSGSVISVFINAQSRWAYDEQNILTEIYQSLIDLLNQKSDVIENITLGAIRELYIKLSRRMRLRNKYVYFVLDGIDEIPSSDHGCRKAIMDMLPIGYHNIRFLISTEHSIGVSKSREYFTPPFSNDETEALFLGLHFNRKQIEEIRKTFRGIPGHMIALRRIAARHTDLSAMLDDLPKSLPEVFELEWRSVELAPDYLLDALAIITFDRKEYTHALLANVLEQQVETIKKKIEGYSFIISSPDNVLSYTSDSYRKFASNKLRARQTRVNNILIDYLLKNPQSDDALRNVPAHLFQAKRFDDLLKYLSPTHFTTLLERSESLVSIQQKAELGVNTARELNRYGDLFRFGVQLSSTALVAGADIWRTEIEARIALKDYAAAKRIAHSALLKENRFHLLVVVAKMQRELDLSIDVDVLEQIDQLYNEIYFEELGDKSLEIAADLVFVRPSLAIQVVEKASKSRAEKVELDWELAHLSFEAAKGQLPKEREFKTAQLIQSKLNDASAQQFAAAAWVLLGTYSAIEVISEVEKIADTSARLSLLRLWAKRNRRRSDAMEIVKYSLDLAISDTSYSVTAQVLQDLAQPLPFIEDEGNRKTLLGTFEAQLIAAERLGPTDDYVSLVLSMIKSEYIHDKAFAFLKLIDLFLYITYISDVSTQASCLARYIVALMIIDTNYELERSERLHSIASEQFSSTIENLLKDSAEHLAAVNTVISTLSRHQYDLAINVAQKLNSRYKRDDAYLRIVKSICDEQLNREQISNAIHACQAIRSMRLREIGIHTVIRKVFNEKEPPQLSDEIIKELSKQAMNIELIDLRCRAIGTIYRWLQKEQRANFSSLASELKERLEKSWEIIDTAWVKTDVGFELVKILSVPDENLARSLLSKCDTVRRDQVFGVNTSIEVYTLCIQLAVRSLSGLLYRKLDNEMDFNRLDELIMHVPCRGTQALIWADIAMRFNAAKRFDECKRIVSAKIYPRIDALFAVEPRLADTVLARSSCAIYMGNQLYAIERIQKLPLPNRDDAWFDICENIIFKNNPFDAFERQQKIEQRLSYEEIGELIIIANNIFSDNLLYCIISDISQIVASKRNRSVISSQQKGEIIRKLEALINSKLPNPEFINHDGWKILAIAQLERIRHSGKQVWESLLQQARGIPNIADRVLVLATLAEMSWGDASRNNGELFEEAYLLVPRIPMILDRIMRLRSIASDCLLSNPSIARKCLSDAMSFAIGADAGDEYAADERRLIIDLAYKIDPSLADKLADMGDADPARLRARAELKQEISVLKCKQEIISNDEIFSSRRSNAQINNVIEAAGRTLASLNAGRVQPLERDKVQECVRFASARPFSQTHPVFALAIESMVKRYRDTPEANNYLRPIFDGAMRASELAWRVAARTTGMIPVPNAETPSPEISSSLLVRVGERDRAVQFIEDWLKTKASQYLKICDPYFSPEDLEWIKRVQSIAPSLRIQILTSMSYQREVGISDDPASRYRAYWRVNLADQVAPDTEIWIVGTEKDGSFPIHDRWILSVESGLRLGTSFNGLGSRESEISILSPPETAARTADLDRYFNRQVRDYDGKRINYNFFDL